MTEFRTLTVAPVERLKERVPSAAGLEVPGAD
jgi:hypothetical protein